MLWSNRGTNELLNREINNPRQSFLIFKYFSDFCENDLPSWFSPKVEIMDTYEKLALENNDVVFVYSAGIDEVHPSSGYDNPTFVLLKDKNQIDVVDEDRVGELAGRIADNK